MPPCNYFEIYKFHLKALNGHAVAFKLQRTCNAYCSEHYSFRLCDLDKSIISRLLNSLTHTHTHKQINTERKLLCSCSLNWIIIYKIAFSPLSQLICIENILHIEAHTMCFIRTKMTNTCTQRVNMLRGKKTMSECVPRDLKLSFSAFSRRTHSV